MTEPEFLEHDAVLFLHDQSIREYGGFHGVRDQNLLASALPRPIDKYAYGAYGEPDLFDLAAAYAFGIARNHAFNDGNKRTAWASCVLFLKVNKVQIDALASKIILNVVTLATGENSEAEFVTWLRKQAAAADRIT